MQWKFAFINGKRVYIGTDEPKDLTAAINQRLELFGRKLIVSTTWPHDLRFFAK